MRTKNLNLKKKIAFIASVAMIASTAAYLPAEVTQNMGASFSVSAAVANLDTDKYDASKNNYDLTEIDVTKLDTLNAFIKVDGKYLGYNATSGEYKLVNSTKDSDFPALLAFATKTDGTKGTTGLLGAATKSPIDEIKGTINDPATGYYSKKVVAPLEIPYIPDAKVITLEFAAKKGATLSDRSITDIDITLNDRGFGRLGKQHDYVVGLSDTSDFDEKKGEPRTAAGEYEVLDLTNLVVYMTGENNGTGNSEDARRAPESINALNGITATTGTNQKNIINDPDADIAYTDSFTNAFAAPLDVEDYEPDSFELTRVNGHFARVIEIVSKEQLEPGTKVDIFTNKHPAWNENGSKDGKITVVMGGNSAYPEFGISGLITHTNGTKKEYFVYVVKNKSNAALDDANALNDELTIDTSAAGCNPYLENAAPIVMKETKVVEGEDEADAIDIKDLADDGIDNNSVAALENFEVLASTRYKIKKKVVKETVNNTNHYVTQYTIYNNESKEDYKADNDKVYNLTFAVGAANGLGSVKDGVETNVGTAAGNKTGVRILEASKTLFGTVGTAADTKLTATNTAAATNVTSATSGDTTLTVSGTNVKIAIKKTAAGTAESEVLQIGDGTDVDLVKIVFQNEYKIKVDHAWDDNKEDLTKVGYDEKVDVAGNKIDRPEKINRLGFEFDGWKADQDNSGVLEDNGTDFDVFRSDDWNEQYNEKKITPNMKLIAKYTGQRYDVVLDANGGVITFAGTSNNKVGSETGPQYFHGTSTKQMTKSNFYSIKRDEQNADLSYRQDAKADKVGYKFLGWSTDKDATKKMSINELEAAFPGEDKVLTLYAVYEAEDNIAVNFKQVLFDQNGVTLDTDGKASKYDNAGAEFTSEQNGKEQNGINCTDDASFSVTPSITVTAGQPIGELPVPYEKGYDFEGWYAKTWNNTLTNVEYVKVDKNTVVDDRLFAKQDKNYDTYKDGDNIAADITLYAKFVQKTFNVTFDIGDGMWENSDIAKPDGELPATMTYSGYRGNKTEAEKLGFRRPDGEVISVETWKKVKNPQLGSGEIKEFSKWTINGKGNYVDLAAVATALTKLTTLEDVTVKAVYEDTESSKSKIYLNANEGDFYVYKQTDKDEITKKPKRYRTNKEDGFNACVAANGNVYIDKNEDGNADNATALSLSKFQMAGLDLDGGTAGIKVSSKWTIDGKNIEETSSAANAKGYTVARAGYDFTGWYTDKECTQKYVFSTYPAKGTEVVLYAGWEKSTTTRFTLEYDIFNGDGSEAKDKQATNADRGTQLSYKKTYMGTIDEIAYAKDLKVMVQDGTGTLSTYKTYVFDPELSKNLNDTSKKIECEFSAAKLVGGLFEQKEPYTTVYGRYVEEGFQNEEKLSAPTNVKVVNGVVTWVGNDVATEYQIKKIVDGKSYFGAKVKTTTATIKNIPDHDYQVAVVAYDKNGNTATSAAVDVIVAPSTLEAPTNVKVSDKGVVTWDAAKGATKYQVLKVVGDSKVYTAKTTDLTATLKSTASDYTVYVIAFDANGKSIRSEAVAGKAFTNGIGVVTDAKYDAETGKITWTPVEGAAKYQIYTLNGKDNTFYSKYVTEGSYTYSAERKPKGSFTFYVIAKDADGKNPVRGTMTKVTSHPSVKNVKLASDNKTVTFDAVDGAVAYQLCKIAPGKKPAYTAVFTGTSKAFTNACTAGTQVYVLAFFDEAHKDASYSETIIVK